MDNLWWLWISVGCVVVGGLIAWVWDEWRWSRGVDNPK